MRTEIQYFIRFAYQVSQGHAMRKLSHLRYRQSAYRKKSAQKKADIAARLAFPRKPVTGMV